MTLLEVARGAWSVVVTIVQIISPFALLWVGWQHTHKETRETEARTNARQLEEAKEQKLLDALAAVTDSVGQANAEIESLRTKLDQYRDDTEELEDSIKHVAALNRLNGRYTHELAQLVVAIGEGVRDQHLDGNITRAITTYRKFESDAIGKLVTDDDPA